MAQRRGRRVSAGRRFVDGFGPDVPAIPTDGISPRFYAPPVSQTLRRLAPSSAKLAERPGTCNPWSFDDSLFDVCVIGLPAGISRKSNLR